MKALFYFCSLFCIQTLIAQEVEWKGSLTATGLFSSEIEHPFWMYANSNTQYGRESNFSGVGSISASYNITEKSMLEVGAALMYRDGVTDEFQRRDVYAQFQNTWMKATLGSKAQEFEDENVSAIQGNYLLTGNARPLGGLLIEANDPLLLSNTFSLDWGVAHYQLNDDRLIKDVRVHYKRLALITTFKDNSVLTAQLQHFAQWGGTSEQFGELRNGLDAFIDVFFAKEGDETAAAGEITNAVGNHLGTYLLDYAFTNSVGAFNIYHEHPFEDGSGTRLANFPDGVWGIEYKPKNNKVFTKILYEYIDTSDQSGTATSGFDNYFSNNLYRSGWTYERNIIGLPFILFDRDLPISEVYQPITSNSLSVHHFGLAGSVKKFDWSIKSSWISQMGLVSRPFDEFIKTWSNYGSVTYTTDSYGSFKVFGAFDMGAKITNNMGGGLEYSYQF